MITVLLWLPVLLHTLLIIVACALYVLLMNNVQLLAPDKTLGF